MLATAVRPVTSPGLAPFVVNEVRRALRNRRYLMLGIGFPVFFYLLSTSSGQGSDPTWRSFFMVSMACYGAIISGISSSTIIAAERAGGWARQLRVTPLPSSAYVLSKFAVSYLVTLPAMTLVLAAGLFINHVELGTAQWIELFAALAVGALPFAALGVLIGLSVDQATAQIVNTICMFGLAILGGLWAPISALPDGLATIGRYLPSFHFADIGWSLVGGASLDPVDFLALAAWAIAFAGVAAWRYTVAERRNGG